MTAQEFNTRFDVLYNNITSNQAPGLDELEKSVFLTKAQDEIIKNYFLRQSNPKQAGFDNNQKRQADFSNIITNGSISSSADANFVSQNTAVNVDLQSIDVFLIINERVEVLRNGSTVSLVVKPISFDEYDRLMQKPFKYPTSNQAWRLTLNSSHQDIVIGPTDNFSAYKIRYVKRPLPIIVGNIGDETINGYRYRGDLYFLENYYYPDSSHTTSEDKILKHTDGECELDESLHEEILQRAVELAKVAWANPNDNTQMLIQTGSRSE